MNDYNTFRIAATAGVYQDDFLNGHWKSENGK
jgi:hypothetical protein